MIQKINELLKKASVVSLPQDSLPPTVFDASNKLLPSVRKAILERILKVLSSDEIKGMYIRGSITGYKYNDASDIDVQVAVENLDESDSKVRRTREINGEPAPNSPHPIDYFLVSWDEMLEVNLAKSSTGIYDVIANGWITPPGDAKDYRPPNEEFWGEIQKAQMFYREFERLSDNYDKAKERFEILKSNINEDYDFYHWEKIKRVSREIEQRYQDLKDFVNMLDKRRKKSYNLSWGYPRESKENITFKFIEHGPHGKLFYSLKEELSLSRAEKRETKTQSSEHGDNCKSTK